jgi:MYXO-CTERM domain-containing protein
MRRLRPTLLAGLLALMSVAIGQPGQAAPRPALVTVIQAVPDASVDVSIDGESRSTGADVGAVLGPFELAPGAHEVAFTADGLDVTSDLDVAGGSSTDVVLHLPAEVDGDPVVHSYDASTEAIGPDKARVLLAHTATVAPADVQVNGETVFTNIANGEFAEADLPAGTHQVALLPSGTSDDPILGPLDVALEAGTLSMFYAYGNPRQGSMNVIAHTSDLAPDGSVMPSRIDTGSAGLVSDSIGTFGETEADPVSPASGLLPAAALALLVAVGIVRHRRQHPTE